ncbi:hypothetical protein QTN25_000421 [Entamoeba marina]
MQANGSQNTSQLVLWPNVSYDDYKKMSKLRIKFPNVVYTRDDRNKYGDVIPDGVTIIGFKCYAVKKLSRVERLERFGYYEKNGYLFPPHRHDHDHYSRYNYNDDDEYYFHDDSRYSYNNYSDDSDDSYDYQDDSDISGDSVDSSDYQDDIDDSSDRIIEN